MTFLLGIKAVLNTTKLQQSGLGSVASSPCALGRLFGMVGLCPPGTPILLQLRGLCRGSVTLLQVACLFLSPVLCRAYSSPVALNLCPPAFGTSRDTAALWRCRAVGEPAAGWVLGVRVQQEGSVLSTGVGPAASPCPCPIEPVASLWPCPGASSFAVPVSCQAVCQGPGEAGAAVRTEAKLQAVCLPGQHRILGRSWAESDCGPATGGSKAAQGLSQGCWGCPWGQELCKAGEGDLPTRMFWGLISPGQLGLDFWGGGMLSGAAWSVLLDYKFGGILRVLLGGSKKCSCIWGKREIQNCWEDLEWRPPLWCQLPAPHSHFSGNSHRRADPPGGAGEECGWELGRDGAAGQGEHARAVLEFLLPLEGKSCFRAQMKIPGALGSFAPVSHRNGGGEATWHFPALVPSSLLSQGNGGCSLQSY